MVAVDVATCTGCRLCELACSFHHQGVFSPELSSIKVTKNNRTAEIKVVIDAACELCRGEEELQCVKSCCFGALSTKEVS